MKKDKIVWRGSDRDNAPVRCTCDKTGYPNFCTAPDGSRELQYANTHFESKEQAWKSIIRSCEAKMSLSAAGKRRVKYALAMAEGNCADALNRYKEINNNPDNPFRNTEDE